MNNFLNTTRRCATCHWWEGERISDPKQNRVYTPRHAVLGDCRSPVSWWEGRHRTTDSVCSFWQQWERVRGPAPGRTRFGLITLGPEMSDYEYLRPMPVPADRP
ncbi:MAG: hypothetical protein HOP28_08395 [Gemmatimonadales bacterium]|nr:hypothetical protein [Gemmatimonadales bacterium]